LLLGSGGIYSNITSKVIAEMAQQLTELLLSNIFGRAGPPGAEAGRIPPRLLTSNVAAKAQIGHELSLVPLNR
jgi:hypothetical protein